jgi:hypothetical protein
LHIHRFVKRGVIIMLEDLKLMPEEERAKYIGTCDDCGCHCDKKEMVEYAKQLFEKYIPKDKISWAQDEFKKHDCFGDYMRALLEVVFPLLPEAQQKRISARNALIDKLKMAEEERKSLLGSVVKVDWKD